MRIVFFGTPEFSCESLRLLARTPHTVAGVVTGVDKPQGRHLKLAPPPVKQTALELGLPVYQYGDVNIPEAVEQIRRLQPDLCVVVSYGKILCNELLAVPRLGSINLHTSLLPELRGAAPIQRAIAMGKTKTGSTIMYVAEKLDAVDIILQEETAIEPADTYGTLSEKLSRQGARLLVKAVDMLAAGAVARVPQDGTKATCARKFSKEEIFINWERSAADIVNLVRALNPKPCAHIRMRLRGEETAVKILEASLAQASGAGACGQIAGVSKDGIVVRAREGAVALLRLQPAGKKEMDAASFINGHQVRHGDRCT